MNNNKKNNFLNNKSFKKILKSSWYPGIFEWIGLLIFSVIIYQLLFGTVNSHANFGSTMTWILWWTILPFMFIFLGRFWCAICPFGKLSDIVRRFVGNEQPLPRFLKKYGIWIIDIFFILITWGDHIWGLVNSPRGSGYLLLVLITMVVITSVYYERRTFCKTLCFLGGLSGNYSRIGMLELRGNYDICRTCKTHDCFKGNDKTEGCPMFQYVRTMDTSADCNLCANCIKTCPHDSISISPRKPTSELWLLKNPKLEHAFLATVIMGIVFVQNITMLDIWDNILYGISNVTQTTNKNINFTVAFLIAMIIPIILLTISSKLITKLDNSKTTKQNFILYGYAIIPLDLAGHLSHNLFHLIIEGKSIWYNTLNLFTNVAIPKDLSLVNEQTVHFSQYIIIFLGLYGSIYTSYLISGKKPLKKMLPIYFLMIVFALVNLYLFSLPMAHRH